MVARWRRIGLSRSLFRSGYELFYTPIPASEKRAAKSLIDVGVRPAGRRGRRRPSAAGAALRRGNSTPRSSGRDCLLGGGLLAPAASIGDTSSRLERSLRKRAIELELSEIPTT